MEGRITFYTYGSTIELNGKLFAAGELTADLLNLSAERYRPMHEQFEQIKELTGEYKRTGERAVWWELNERLEDLRRALRGYKLFRLILGKDDVLLSEARSYTERYSLLPEEDRDWDDHTANQLAEMSRQYAGDEAEEISDLFHTGSEYNYEIEFERRRGQEDEPDDPRFQTTPDFFIIWAGNSEQKWRYYENVIDRYGMYLHDIRAFNTTIHNFIRYMLHALYCEGACPAAPRFTCRQFGTMEVQKELAKDIPKVRAKLAAFERITKDQRRGAIPKEDARRAKDYVRDLLYDALRDKEFSLEEFERRIAPQALYASCGIVRKAKPRGRPRKQKDGEST